MPKPDTLIARLTAVIGSTSNLDDEMAKLLKGEIETLGTITDAQVFQLLTALSEFPNSLVGARAVLTESLLSRVLIEGHQRVRTRENRPRPPGTLELAQRIYLDSSPESFVRGYLLALLVVPPSAEGLRVFARLVVESPPLCPRSSDYAFAHLFQMRDISVTDLFPKILDGLAHTTVAASIIDLANHLFRREKLSEHPAKSHSASLANLLGGIVQRLGRLEDDPLALAEDADQTVQQITHSVQLAVSLCDALGLIREDQFVGKLFQAMELRHRRIRTEAAFALAKLGEQAGRQTLFELAAEPVARLRVISYAEELGLTDQIAEEHRTPLALAESELAAWLSEPAQFGVAPTSIELIECRTMYWPGYDEPQMCYLFRFNYETPNGIYSNIGIAGPLTQSFQADLGNLSPDDLYAVFAGWHAMHDEIFELDAEGLPQAMQADLARWRRRLHDDGHSVIRPQYVGNFFGERLLIAESKKEGRMGTAIVDVDTIYWYPSQGSLRPLTSDDAYNIIKGRKLLRAFNGVSPQSL